MIMGTHSSVKNSGTGAPLSDTQFGQIWQNAQSETGERERVICIYLKKLITVVFELKLSGSLRLTLFSSVSVFWRRKGEERCWGVLGFKTPHSCLTWTRTTEHTDTGRHTPHVHFYPWSTISTADTAHDYIHVHMHALKLSILPLKSF